ELPGIGEAIAAKIREYVTTGHIKHLDDLLAQQGGISPALMEIEDLGPKRVRMLQRERGIATLEQLTAAAKAGKLRELPGFSELIAKLNSVRDGVAHGEKKLSFNIILSTVGPAPDKGSKNAPGLRVDIRFVKPSQWGSALLYFTGDKEHNIMLRKIAIGKGWKL